MLDNELDMQRHEELKKEIHDTLMGYFNFDGLSKESFRSNYDLVDELVLNIHVLSEMVHSEPIEKLYYENEKFQEVYSNAQENVYEIFKHDPDDTIFEKLYSKISKDDLIGLGFKLQ